MIFRTVTAFFEPYLILAYVQSESLTVSVNSMSPLLLMNSCILFMSALTMFMKTKKARMNESLKITQERQIVYLNREITRRTNELNNLRQTLASDFHDETGNLLLVIIHQAALLQLRADKDVQPIVENILDSSQQLYASSKHFLWNLNNDSEDPHVLFQYLMAFGQSFFNKFDISFSVENQLDCSDQVGRLEPHAAINLVFIFKEAMNNIVKHAGAREVVLKMSAASQLLIFTLADDGTWKEPDPHQAHYGLESIERRCARNSFTCLLRHHNDRGTQIEISVPVISIAQIVQYANHKLARKNHPFRGIARPD